MKTMKTMKAMAAMAAITAMTRMGVLFIVSHRLSSPAIVSS